MPTVAKKNSTKKRLLKKKKPISNTQKKNSTSQGKKKVKKKNLNKKKKKVSSPSKPTLDKSKNKSKLRSKKKSTKKASQQKNTVQKKAKKTVARQRKAPVLFAQESVVVEKNKYIYSQDNFLDDKENIRENENSYNSKVEEADSDSFSHEKVSISTIRVRQSAAEVRSPHVVDLKRNEERVSNPKDVYSKRSYSWENKLARVERKIFGNKKNYLSEEEVEPSVFIGKKSQNRLNRSAWLARGFMSEGWEKSIEKLSSWGEKQTQTYLNKRQEKPTLERGGNQMIKENSFYSYQGNGFYFSRSLAGLLIMSLLFVLPFKAFTFYQSFQDKKSAVLGESTSVYQEVSGGVSAMSRFDFDQAKNSFLLAEQSLDSVNDVLQDFPPFLLSAAKVMPNIGRQINAGERFIKSGLAISRAGTALSQTAISLSQSEDDYPPTEKLNLISLQLKEAHGFIKQADELLGVIEVKDVPVQYQNQFAQLQPLLPAVLGWLEKGIALNDFAYYFLGGENPMRYLFVFQNTNELRPTGGFIGSLAEVDIDQGNIERMFIPSGGVYDLQGNLEVLVSSPEPLHLINANWQLQDANWFYDFPHSAQKIMWFYEKSGGPTVDGVVAFNSSLLPSLLEITGPVSVPGYEQIYNASNVLELLQEEIEKEYDKNLNQPKKILTLLLPKILEKVANTSNQDFMRLFSLLNHSLLSRTIQLYHTEPSLQSDIQQLGYGGEVKTSGFDYLALVDSNIGGGKADAYIDQEVKIRTKISLSGQVINKVIIRKTYSSASSDIFTENDYHDYLRLYVPLGSRLLSAEGFLPPLEEQFSSPTAGFEHDEFLQDVEKNKFQDQTSQTYITEEFNRTVFGNWVKLLPGETKEFSFTYQLPTNIKFQQPGEKNFFLKYFDKISDWLNIGQETYSEFALYTLYIQKQSGQKAWPLVHEVSLPLSWDSRTSNNLQNKVTRRQDQIFYQEIVDNDKFWGTVFIK